MESMPNMTARAEEKKRLAKIVKQIEFQIAELEKEAKLHKDEMLGAKRHFWDDVSVNIDDPG